MIAIPKPVGVLLCGFLLSIGLSTPVQAADQKEMTVEKRVHIIQGDVMRVEYGTYFVKQRDGKEVGLETDKATQMMGQIKKGDRIVATVNELNHALSIQAIP